jgi:hypothetical protein
MEKPTHLINVPRHKQGNYTRMQGKQAEHEVSANCRGLRNRRDPAYPTINLCTLDSLQEGLVASNNSQLLPLATTSRTTVCSIIKVAHTTRQQERTTGLKVRQDWRSASRTFKISPLRLHALVGGYTWNLCYGIYKSRAV